MYLYNLGLTFRTIAEDTGDRTAIVVPGRAGTSYRELNRLANRIAHVFLGSGLQHRDVVAIVHDKSAACYAVMIAALKCGITYVNIDDQNPAPRLAHIFGTALPKLLIGPSLTEPVAAAARAAGASVRDMDDDAWTKEVEAASSDEPPGVETIHGSDPAYIMYTSGSTGVPKGALMSHANVLNFGQWIGSRFNVTGKDVLTNVNPMYFDNSVFDFYGAMLNGAGLAPVPRSALSDAKGVVEAVERAACTIWFSVPSMLIYLMSMKVLTAHRLSTIRSFVFGGEGYPKPELRKLFALYAERASLINVYGPTECTCMCSAWNVRPEDVADDDGLVTLGPIAENFSALVLDEDRAVGDGQVGELCLAGPQVGLGYVNDAERTAKAFVQNPLNAGWSERVYRTGDLVRLRDGMMLDFVGRRDNQVKHMGYRIELEEIEAALHRLPGVTRSAVLQMTGRRGAKLIVAFVAGTPAEEESELRAQLEGFLPPYMIPQRFFVRGDLPKNANGKVDKIALSQEELPL